ncbi:MAG: hypothetical protein E7637_06415 [Ruminococcaceae bacterium]|nr:hypothetical protein [Oscillospiraceae bacterium]
MYIGLLHQKSIAFTHADSSRPLPPSVTENGGYRWNWDDVFDTALDIRVSLEHLSLVGSVVLSFAERSTLKKVEVLSDGKPVGVYCAETDKRIGGKITVPIGAIAQDLTVRLYADLESITLESLSVFGTHDDGKPFVWPQPKRLTLLGDTDPIGEITSASSDPDEVFAASFLRERLNERHGVSPRDGGLRIVFVKDTSDAFLNERYTVETTDNTVVVTAASRLALLYGADTLLQLSDRAGLPRVSVDDQPSKEIRGLHIGLPAREDFEFTKRLFRYLMIPLRYNMLIVEFAGGMRFDKHPEISEAWLRAEANANAGLQPKMPHSDMVANGTVLEKKEVSSLLDSARQLGIEVVPEIQSLGHVQYITYAHPELAERIETPDGEVDTRADDTKPVGFYPHCYCPSLQASYDLIYDIIDEIVEVVKPARYVHMGHDEIYHIGRCKRCQTKRPEDLYCEHVTAMYEHLKKKGLKMMIWSDMPHADPARKYYVPKARERLPRDILMMDFVWYFRPEEDIEEELLPFGYQLAVGNLYSSHYPRYRKRIARDGMLGGQISLWLRTDEETPATKGKWWDMMYLSQMLWNAEDYEEDNRTAYTEVIASYVQPLLRDELRGDHAPNGYSSALLPLPTSPENKPFAPLSALCPQAMLWRDGEVTANARYDRLVFLHATAWSAPIDAWKQPIQIGTYRIRYEDGSEENAPIRYGQQILCYNRRYGEPMPQKYYRHTGYTGTWFSDPVYQGHSANGEPLCVTGYVWQNPHPEKSIASIAYRPAEEDICGLILVGIAGENKE